MRTWLALYVTVGVLVGLTAKHWLWVFGYELRAGEQWGWKVVVFTALSWPLLLLAFALPGGARLTRVSRVATVVLRLCFTVGAVTTAVYAPVVLGAYLAVGLAVVLADTLGARSAPWAEKAILVVAWPLLLTVPLGLLFGYARNRDDDSEIHT